LFNSFEFRNKALSIIKFHEHYVKSGLRNRKQLKEFLISVFKQEHVFIRSIRIIFCNDVYLRYINKQFLKHDYNTDTVTFILSDQHQPIDAEAYISIDSTKANSRKFNVTHRDELMRVIIHSCLHMAGYTDKVQNEASIMQQKQEHYLLQWNVSRETHH